jgi:hypothetical protein
MSTEMARNVGSGQSRDFDLITVNSMGDGGRNPGLDPYLQKLGKIRGLDTRLLLTLNTTTDLSSESYCKRVKYRQSDNFNKCFFIITLKLKHQGFCYIMVKFNVIGMQNNFSVSRENFNETAWISL